MGSFESTKFFMNVTCDLSLVAADVEEHFRANGYETTKESLTSGMWTISIRKGNTFQSVIGMKTALNIEIEPCGNGIRAKAGIGIFGQQAIPTAITMRVFWPVLITQVWGLVKQAKLDDVALECIRKSLMVRGNCTDGNVAATREANIPAGNGLFCTRCGCKMPTDARFCPGCGGRTG